MISFSVIVANVSANCFAAIRRRRRACHERAGDAAQLRLSRGWHCQCGADCGFQLLPLRWRIRSIAHHQMVHVAGLHPALGLGGKAADCRADFRRAVAEPGHGHFGRWLCGHGRIAVAPAVWSCCCSPGAGRQAAPPRGLKRQRSCAGAMTRMRDGMARSGSDLTYQTPMRAK